MQINYILEHEEKSKIKGKVLNFKDLG